MKVKDLIKKLQKVDPNRVVILQKDSEGNGHSPLDGLDDNCVYEPESTWSGGVGIEKLTSRLRKQGFTKEDVGSGKPALVLFPVN